MKYVSLSSQVTCGESPQSDEDIQRLADDEFQSVFNIRPTRNVAEYTSREEGIGVRNARLSYLNYPIARDQLDEFHISAFRTKLKLLPAPTYVHGASFSKAAMLCVIDHALNHQWSIGRALAFTAELDLPCCEEPWKSRLHQALEAA